MNRVRPSRFPARHARAHRGGSVRRGYTPEHAGLRARPGVLRPMSDPNADITLLLRAAASGRREHVDLLMNAIYEDMRRLANVHLQAERSDHTLQPTALVHEAYLKLINQHSAQWSDRIHFFAVASQIIRRILIDHARERKALKRGGSAGRFSLTDRDIAAPLRDEELLALDEALAELAEIDPRQARIVELRYFGGCTVEETAELLGVGPRTIDRDWQAAKAWLYCRMTESGQRDGD